MAQKHIVQLIDDLDGVEAQETVSFSLDGTRYEIDLSADNAAELRDSLAVYIANARRASALRRRPQQRRAAARTGPTASRPPRSGNGRATTGTGSATRADPVPVLEAYHNAH